MDGSFARPSFDLPSAFLSDVRVRLILVLRKEPKDNLRNFVLRNEA